MNGQAGKSDSRSSAGGFVGGHRFGRDGDAADRNAPLRAAQFNTNVFMNHIQDAITKSLLTLVAGKLS